MKEPSAGLLLDTPKQLMSGNEYGPIITRMLPDESILVERIEINPANGVLCPLLAKETPAHLSKSRLFANGSSKALNRRLAKLQKPKQAYQPKDQRNNSPLSHQKYGKNDKNPGLEFTPMPENNMRISHSLIRSKAQEIDQIVQKNRVKKGSKTG